MAITFVSERWPERSAQWGEKSRSYVRTFVVRTDTMLDDAQAVMQAKGLPRLGDYYESPDGLTADLAVRVTSVSPAQLESPFEWVVTVEYTTEAEDRNDPGSQREGEQGSETASETENQSPEQPEQPTSRPLRVRTSFERGTKLLTHTYDNPPRVVKNSAGESLDPPPEVEDDTPIISITRIEDAPSFALIVSYRSAVNSDEITIGDLTVSARCAKMRNIAISDTTIDGQRCYEVTYEIALSREGWNPVKILDQGYYEQQGDRVPILDSNGNPVSSPQPLDGNGFALVAGQEAVFLEFKGYYETAFQPLGLWG